MRATRPRTSADTNASKRDLVARPPRIYTLAMLAYVSWHWPAPAVERDRYVDLLVAFHRALRAAPPPGFRGSRVLAIDGAPWTPSTSAFEDWYLLDDFAALGALNEAAITAARQAPHDAVARLAGGGAGGVYRRLSSGSSGAGIPDRVHWASKPPGESYAAFLARLPAVEVWQRQLVLGPAPELCVLGPPPAGAESLEVRAQVVEGTA